MNRSTAFAILLFVSFHAFAGESGKTVGDCKPHKRPGFPQRFMEQFSPAPASLQTLHGMSRHQLDALFATGTVGSIPQGNSRGIPILVPSGHALDFTINRLWTGKDFRPDGTLKNKIFGMFMAKAEVYKGSTRDRLALGDSKVIPGAKGARAVPLDRKPSIMLDYKNASPVWRGIVDEIRKVKVPGHKDVYLGRAMLKGKFVCYFALQF